MLRSPLSRLEIRMTVLLTAHCLWISVFAQLDRLAECSMETGGSCRSVGLGLAVAVGFVAASG